jgi:acyl-CoA reductase-like NAD-dependent aldehyde dehydrogenase
MSTISAADAGLPYDLSDEVRAFLSRSVGHVIDGEERASADGQTFTTLDPATAAPLAEVAYGSATDVEHAVASARRAFDEGPWPQLPPAARSRLIHALADAIEAHADTFAELESLDNGKPRAIAAAHDLPGAVETLRYYAGWATKIEGAVIPVSLPGTLCTTRREPVGVCAQIIPWNFPLSAATWKIGPALAAGCTMVLKPAEQTPLTALLLGRLAIEAGFPPGVLNVVAGDGATGAALVAAPGVDKVAFTGSTEVGREIATVAGRQLKRVTLELGGKSPLIVLPDADLDFAAAWAFGGMYYNTGQVCTAASRLLVHASIYDALLERVALRAGAAKLGPGMDAATELGPVVSAEQRDRVLDHIAGGVADGAELVAGGADAPVSGPGFFVAPTVFSATGREEPRVAREEVFGPVLVASPYDDVDGIVARANSTEFGLAAGILTSDPLRGYQLAARLRSGIVFVNQWGALDPAAPFGGVKASGMGRELGREGLDAYLDTKTVWLALPHH